MAQNQFEEYLRAALTGGLQGAQAGMASGRELEKAVMLEKIKSAMTPREWKPTTREEYLETKRAEAGIKPPTYKTVGGKLLSISPTGEEPSVIYEDPEKIQAAKDALSTTLDDTDNMLTTIQRIKEGKHYFGPLGEVPTSIIRPLGIGDYGKRLNWEKNIQYLLSNLWVDKIKSMKAAGRGSTGLGSMTEKEGSRIENATTALSKAQNPDEAIIYLNEIEASLKKIQATARRKEASIISQPKYRIGQEIDTPKGRVRVIGGDMNDPDVEPI